MKTKLFVLFLMATIGILILKNYNVKETTFEINYENNVLQPEIIEPEIVYDGLTREELIEKINKSLNSTIANKGELYVDYCLEKGVDPYLAVAITLHETGCKWECSKLVKNCNNVGGQKGSPTCNGGAYKRYETLDDGIRGYIDNLYNNYIKLGLITPEQIGPKYAVSYTWANKINKYLEEIKSK